MIPLSAYAVAHIAKVNPDKVIRQQAEALAVRMTAENLLAMTPPDPHAEDHRNELATVVAGRGTCIANGCKRTARAWGLCDTDYRRLRRIMAGEVA